MTKFISVLMLLALWATGYAADDIKKISMPPAQEMNRADLYIWKKVADPQAVLILSPGYNQSGEGWIREKVWQDFAETNNLALVGLSFASDERLFQQQRGYYYASKGAGKVLLDGIRKAFHKDLPLLLYGFSGGAHFTSRFVEWRPDRVITWCAYSAAWWDEPQKADVMPPGIVVCGDQDERYGASLLYFKQGRAVGKPWLWISLPGIGHSRLAPLDQFVRDYFSAVLQNKGNGLWVDIDQKFEISAVRAGEVPSVSGWIPSRDLLDSWKSLHK